MTGIAAIAAAFVAGVLSSASPCVAAAVPITVGFVGSRARSTREAVGLSGAFVGGMTLTFVVLGLAAARLGVFFGVVGGPWTVLVGIAVAGAGLWLLLRPSSICAVGMPPEWQSRFGGSGWIGAAVLGALVGTVMSPCATPALAAALSVAGTGALSEGSVWLGGVMLLAYGLGHSVLLFAAGVAPAQAQRLLSRLVRINHWLPGRRTFAAVMILAGTWLAITGAGLL
jgi:cytochrome c-type biogenesis protein